MSNRNVINRESHDIAVVGMSCRFPGARNVSEYWKNLCRGVESVSFFSPEELLSQDIPAERVLDPDCVAAYGVMPDAYAFDPSFFGMNQNEAIVADPQQRVFLECAWTALEDAGCDPTCFAGAIGVFAGSSVNDYFARVSARPELLSAVGHQNAFFANCRDFLTTRISYKLGLSGPSVAVQTACSTSLVAIHMACQSLLNYESDVALAGGASIASDQVSCYKYEEGGILSPDGHCRAFDFHAAGTVRGSGVGVVVLKRVEDAVRDQNTIYAVVKGSAINNDGKSKVGFAAPSISGQAAVIAEALTLADVEASTITYLETHGTGTPLGDPIEIAALKDVFGIIDHRQKSCTLGAVKTNIGHLDAAAGVAGFIKTVLALRHRILPPTLHFTKANPETGLDDSPFYVSTILREWSSNQGFPRRAGVSSFGIGGTNAHVVLEEAPEVPKQPDTDHAQVVVLSAKSAMTLEQMSRNLIEYLKEDHPHALADVAYTLQQGRIAHPYRLALVARNANDAQLALAASLHRSPMMRRAAAPNPSVVFLFPGQGTECAGMGRELYAREPVFRRELDRCADAVAADLEVDLRTALFKSPEDKQQPDELLRRTHYIQPALFAVEYALANLLISWGIRPDAMLGHSVGEYTAACIAGVFSPEETLRLLIARGRLMESLPEGRMIAVRLPEQEVRAVLPARLSLAAVNTPEDCVISGDLCEVRHLEEFFEGRGVPTRPLKTTCAFHSSLMDPILEPFSREVSKMRRSAPSLRFISNVTGEYITEARATDPNYWAQHLRMTVRFSDGVRALLSTPDCVLVEVGPGTTLATFARRIAGNQQNHVIAETLGASKGANDDHINALSALGSLWTAGAKVDWSSLAGGTPRRRVSLPPYPFDRAEYRLRRSPASSAPQSSTRAHPIFDIGQSLHRSKDLPTSSTTMNIPTKSESNEASGSTAAMIERVGSLFAHLLGSTIVDLDVEKSFLELGADSLLLMQASRRIETDFGVRVPFRRLIDGLSTIKTLSAHLERELPEDRRVQLVAKQVSSESFTRTAAESAVRDTDVIESTLRPASSEPCSRENASGIQSLLGQQLAVMRMQIELLRSAGIGDRSSLAMPAVALEQSREQGTSLPETRSVPPHDQPIKTVDSNGPVSDTNAVSHGPHRPVRQTLNLAGNYSEPQKRHVEDLVRRYNAKTQRSKSYATRSRATLADNRAVLGFRIGTKELIYPVVAEHSAGSRFWDLDGNEYIDFTCGFGVHLFGHRPRLVVEAIEKQSKQGFHLGPQSNLAGPAAALFCEVTGMDRAAFCTTGSEAVMTAIRIARAFTGRDRVVMFQGAYHGNFDGVLARNVGGHLDPKSRPVAPGVPQKVIDDVVVLPYGEPFAVAWLKANAASVAAVLVDPVQVWRPEFRPVQFLHDVRDATRQNGIVLIFDEMISGLRLGPRGAQGLFSIDADLATYGKVAGGGFPIGIVAGKAYLMDLIDGGQWSYGDDSFPEAGQTFFAGTYCKHPFVMATACAVLEHIKNEGDALYEALNARTARLVTSLEKVAREEGLPIEIPSCGSLFSIRVSPDEPWADLLFYHLIYRGIYIWERRSCFLSTAHTDDDCDRLVLAFQESVSALRQGGFIRGRHDSQPETSAKARALSFPLTPAQRQIWTHVQLGGDASLAYNEQIVFHVRGRLDLAALRRSLEDLMYHHEGLRTVFDPAGEVQNVLPSLPVLLHDESHEGKEENNACQRTLIEASEKVFDLQSGPLFRVHVHRHSTEDHIVQIVFHHLIMDALGLDVFLRDLETAYLARREQKAPRFPPAMQMSEYAGLWKSYVGAHGECEAKCFARFHGASPLVLSTDRPRPRFPTNPAANLSFPLKPVLAAKLREVGRAKGRTLLMNLLGALVATLHRLADQEDILVGIVSGARPFPGSESLVGQCAHILPIRSTITETTSLAQVLSDVRQSFLDAFEYEVFSLERLAEQLRISKGPGAPPIISVVLNIEPGQGAGGEAPARFGGHAIEGVTATSRFAKFDITLNGVESGDKIDLVCEFNSDLFERETIQRMLGHLERVLEQVSANADVRISELELMGSEERRRLLYEWNDTAVEYPRDQCIHELFEEQVSKTPDAVAAVYEGESLSYGELNRRANQLAHHLIGRGVGPEDIVGICLQRSVEMVVALLGVVKAGAAYLPLDPEYPADRLEFMLKDADPVCVLTGRERGVWSVPQGVELIDLGEEEVKAGLRRSAGDNPTNAQRRCGLLPQHPVYVIYTSGSTGRPKAVLNTHQGLVNRISWMQQAYVLGAEDRVLQKTPYSFDVSVWEFFWPLLFGARLVMAVPGKHRDAEYLIKTIVGEGISTVHFVPSMLEVFLEQPEASRCSDLRRVICSGEALSGDLQQRFLEQLSGVELHNLYGPTEASIDVTERRCLLTDGVRTPPIGKPIWNTRVYVLNRELEPVPVSVSGELYLAGVGLARGYLNRPGLTAERFVPDPFAMEAGERMYRTGDRMRWDAEGSLEFLGRFDEQVKIRGFRIEPGEVESVLGSAAGVREVRVMVREDAPGEKRLVAYVVGDAEAEQLRLHVKRSLPDYMVPAAFVSLERLPLTPNGKLDRKALPVPEVGGGEAGYIAPRTPVEEVLAKIWAEVLGVERVGVNDNFFELGGHSLLAIRTISRIRQVFGIEMPVRAMYDQAVLGESAEVVEGLRRTDMVALPPVTRVERQGAPQLSFAQERLWFLDRMGQGGAAYNTDLSLRLSGELDVESMERALGEVVRRHEVLRTVFAEVDGAPVQVITPFAGFCLPVEEMCAVDEEELRREIREELVRPFDLQAGPLLRARLLRVSEQEHVLLVNMHHIVTDGWSMEVLQREMSMLYEAYRKGEPSPLPEPAVQYADYASWQREQLQGEFLHQGLAYWKGQLAGAPALLDLPADHPRPAVQSYRGAQEVMELPLELLERLHALGRREGVTLFMVLLGAWQVLLSKYSGSEDVVVGSPIAGRNRREIEDLIGFFVNMLVLRTDLSGDPSFRQVLGQVREVALSGYEHQEVPFEKLVAELQPERSLSHSPLFQVAFQLQEAGDSTPGLSRLQMHSVGVEPATAKFDLQLDFGASSHSFVAVLVYSTDLFERETIQRMLGHLERVLEQVSANADVRISELELMGSEERRRLLYEWNDTAVEYPRDQCIHELFEEQVSKTPDAVAAVYEGESLSYGELNRRANQLAHHLIGRGVGPEDIVGICLQRSVEMVVALLGVVKAGAAYLPLDPEYPADRLEFMLKDADPVCVLTGRERGVWSVPQGVELIDLGEEEVKAGLRRSAGDNPTNAQRRCGLLPQHPVYVIYTSGSTGRPKAVLNTHQGLVNRISWMQQAYVLGAEDRVLQKTPYSFDVSVWEFFWPLLFGARLVMAVPGKHRDAEYLIKTIVGEGISTVHFVPSMLEVFLEQPEASRCSDLRRVICSGEALSGDLQQRFLEQLSGVELHNLYGPTEASIDVTERRCLLTDGVRTPPIGKPIWNTRVYVLNRELEPVPVSVSGELYLAGVGLARGYLNRPGLTAERFVPDPFAMEAGERMYRTGDRMRWDAEGSLEFLGRFDEQVKIRGFRIEPGEVESVLGSAAGVREVRVMVREDAPGEKRLVAYVVGDAEAEQLRLHVKRSLPDYMVPAAFVSLERLPLTPNGKLDRKALPVPEVGGGEAGYIAPRTPVEEVLAKIWAEVLGVERVGVNDNFFELGGHSLLAIRTISRIRQVFGIEMPVRAMYDQAVLGESAEVVEGLRRTDMVALPPVTRVERQGAPQLSFAQERLWFLDRMGQGGAAYNTDLSLRLSGELDVESMERALGEVVRRHEVLRTVFAEVDGAPVQVITPFTGFRLPVEEMCAVDVEEVRREIREELVRPFDLQAGPLLRARLLRVSEQEHVLLVNMHHIVTDGWSMEVLQREMSMLYEAYRKGEPSPLPELAVQYADYASWQREQLQGEFLHQGLAYWKGQLAGAPALLDLPADHPRAAVQSYRGAQEVMELPLELLGRLHALGRREGVTLFMVLLGAWQVLLSKYSGSEDVVVGSPIAGRNRREIEDLIGFFVNMLVLRTDLSGDPSFRQVLGRVREVALSGYEHQEVPFEKLVAELQPERSLSHSPLFQVAFQLQEAGDSRPGLPRLQMHSVGVEPATAKFDLQLDFGASSHSFVAVLVYSTDLFERETIQRMLGHLERVLEQVSANADVRISELELMGSEERRRLLYEWNDTAVEYPRGQCIHELFAEQVSKRPDAVALVWGREVLSYQELNRRSNQLAHYLAGLGVGPESRVGVMLERGVDLIVSLLAILKAGGAYVPLDPSYPEERLKYMLGDAEVGILVSRADLSARLTVEDVHSIWLDEVAELLEAASGEETGNRAVAENIAYIVYTSGSTGRPKGVIASHRGVVQLVVGTDYVQLGPGDRIAQASNASFDALTFELWGALLNGATLIGIDKEALLSPTAMGRVLEGQGVTTLYQTTALLNELSSERPELLANLREVLFGGQAVDAESVRRILRYGKPLRLLHMYGPTETTAWCTYETVNQVVEEARTVSVGRPTANQRMYILDSHLQPTVLGVGGEGYAAGAGLARGYLNRPGLTAERFVPDPFAMEAGERMYRTGDRMRWGAEGSLEFLGRFDEQVKIRGFRIEPGEVESVLGSAAGVREVRVMVREDAPGEKRLVAYVVGDAEAEQLRLHVKRSLPDYMVPAAFVSLERLPLTPNGKLDRKALPVPEVGGGEAGYIAPRTPVEEVLAKIWAEVLGVERVGVNDNFFALGGHSLTVMRLATRIRFAFGIEFPIRSAFSNPTIQAMAEEIEYITQNEIIAMPEEQAERLAMNSRWAANNISTLVELP